MNSALGNLKAYKEDVKKINQICLDKETIQAEVIKNLLEIKRTNNTNIKKRYLNIKEE